MGVYGTAWTRFMRVCEASVSLGAVVGRDLVEHGMYAL